MSEEINNLNLWEQVERTDPSATKTANLGGREQTSIGSYYMFKRATELFGPVGIGWGFDIVEERWDAGAPMIIKLGEADHVAGPALTHTVRINFWYMLNGVKGEIPAYGHTQAVYKSKYGISDDGEAPKKSLTDAIKKALSMLGFSADIFTGMYDNKDYVAQLKTEEEISKAEDRDAEVANKRKETGDYVIRHIEAINNASSVSEVNGIQKVTIRHLERQKLIRDIADICEAGIKKIGIESEVRKQTLLQTAEKKK